MAGSVNKVILIGNLGKDPEVRNSSSGSKIVTFNLATSETWNDKATNERKEKTEWHRVVIFNDRLADVAERYLKKGKKIYLEGSLQTRKWTDQSGVEKYTTEVVLDRFRGDFQMIDGGARGGEEGESGGYSGGYQARDKPAAARAPAGGRAQPSWEPPSGSDLDDEIPF